MAAVFRASRGRLVAGVVALLAASGCGGGNPSTAPSPVPPVPPPSPADAPTTTSPAATVPFAATANVPRVEVFNTPVQPEPAKIVENPQPDGAAPGFTLPLRMLVVEDRGEWLKVLLPLRPNGSSGWIRRSVVDLEERHDYRILVELGEHRITVWNGDDVVLQEPVAVGASGRTPTTQGQFYTLERYEVEPAQQGAYGPYAISLSGYSEVLYSFGGGTGVLGIHGTADTSGLGRDVSNGCIRMSNSAITRLVEMLPSWGVPVEIKA